MEWETGLFIGMCLMVLAGCLLPNRYLPPLPNDKLMHAAAFALLSVLALRLTHTRIEAAAALLGLLLAGWLIECLQQLVPDRQFCWRDIAANAGGIAATAVCALAHGAAAAVWRSLPTI